MAGVPRGGAPWWGPGAEPLTWLRSLPPCSGQRRALRRWRVDGSGGHGAGDSAGDAGHPRRLRLARGDRRQRRAAGAHADLHPALADLSARLSAHLRPRCRPAGRADGQLRGRPSEHRRGPGGAPGAGADRRRGRRRHDRHGTGVHRADRPAEGVGRHVPPDRPGLARRRALAPGPRRRAGAHAAGGRGADRAARLHRRARHAAAIRGGRPCPAGAPRCRRACGSPPSAAATTPWIATSAGTASPRPTPPWPTPTAPRFADPADAVRDAYAHGRVRRVRRPRRDRRLPGDAGRRRHPVLQLPRRPGAGDPRRAARSRLRRLSPRPRCRASPPPSA